MRSKICTVESEHLERKVEIPVYGHFGYALLFFPCSTDDPMECEKRGIIDASKHFITNGGCKFFCAPGINEASWKNKDLTPENSSELHFKYNLFITDELVPLIYEDCGGPVPIITCGMAAGAYHAANTYFRRPDIFLGCIAIDGSYDIRHLSGEYFDENCYFNSPVDYLPNLNDPYWMSFLMSRHHVFICSGSGDGSNPDEAYRLGNILNDKNIPHKIDIRGTEFGFNCDSWKSMLSHILANYI
mgnify:CR=1 FL=1